MINLILLNLISLIIIYLFLVYIFKNIKMSGKKKIFILIILGILITFYVRGIVFTDNINPFGDEKKYVEILELKEKGISHPISGLGYANMIYGFSKLTGINFSLSSLFFACVVSIFTITIIYLLYKKQMKKENFAFLSVISLLLTSYFLYPSLEGRPQQIGMILVLAGILLLENYLENKNNTKMILFSLLYFIVFYYHILSFAILTILCFLLCTWRITEEKNHPKDIIFFPIIFILSVLIYFLPNSFYKLNRIDFINTSRPFWEKLNLQIISLLILLIILLFFGLVYSIKFLSNFKKSKKKLRNFWVVYLISFIALTLQFLLNKSVYMNFYNNSLIYFLFFQLPNIFFGIFFLLGIKQLIEEEKSPDIFLKSSIGLLMVGLIVVFISIFLDFALNNLLIRILNYWTIFASPVVAYSIKSRIKSKRIKFIILPLLIIIALINASRNPLFFKFP